MKILRIEEQDLQIYNVSVNPKTILWGMFLIAVGLRILYVTIFLDPNEYIFSDTRWYNNAALDLANKFDFWITPNNEGIIYSLEPLFALFLTPFALFSPGYFLPVRIALSILLSISVFPFFKICRHLVNPFLSLIGAFIFLFYPFYIFISGLLYPAGIVMILLVFLTYYIFEFIDRRSVAAYFSYCFILFLLFFSSNLKAFT